MSYNISLSSVFAGSKKVGRWWNFKNVSSPFYRLYLVTEGCGHVYIEDECHTLDRGSLFLIPKFALHSYRCDESMDHLYICFFDDMVTGNGINYPMELLRKIQATDTDRELFNRYIELNPTRSLQTMNPAHYTDGSFSAMQHGADAASDFESQGILTILFSRFITGKAVARVGKRGLSDRIDEVMAYISNNLNRHLSVRELSELSCMSERHFTRVFTGATGMTPSRYIQRKRVSRAQGLMLTSGKSMSEIAAEVGIENQSQFTRLFKKISGSSPSDYRNKITT